MTFIESPEDTLKLAEDMNAAIRSVSDLLKGMTKTLVDEGWPEDMARAIVLRVFMAGLS